ncbi:hypothetical protein BHYA_0139g00190 [Botrytis hyacinthi]|uniref:Uncharacterized protein n=1 Tax=Botrytis hyacinthi TaxID=278943 RepID=A0A4Z1GKG9_9HELO|nr:hypothetical protein BHYA_0139g00190 [Botrytis hyacinthi]
MDLPEFAPRFIQLENKHPSRSDSYHSSMFWEKAIPRLARHTILGQDQKAVTDKYKAKCVEYYGDTVHNNYFMYCWDKSISNYFFPGENFVGSDPDPIYSGVFAQYFNEQAQVRDELNECGVYVTEQVDVLISLSKVYNNQLQLARRPPRYSPGNVPSGARGPSPQGSTPGSIPAEDYDAALPEKKRRMEKAVTKVLSEGLDRDWVVVKDIQEEGWVLVERESR